MGIGFTTTVAVIDGPIQVTPALVKLGVIVKVTVTGALVVLVNVPLILPAPLAPIPVTATVLSLVQLYTVPATLPVSAIVVIAEPEQIVCEEGVATAFGIGLTVITNVCGAPGQPLAVGVTVIVPDIAAFVPLVAVKVGNELPEPLAPNPMAILLFVHANVVPATLLVKFKVPVGTNVPLQ